MFLLWRRRWNVKWLQRSHGGRCGWLRKQSLPPVGRVVGHFLRGEGEPVWSRDSVLGWAPHCPPVWEGCKDCWWGLYWEASLGALGAGSDRLEKCRQVCALGLVGCLYTIHGIKAGLIQMVIQGPCACFINNSFDLFFGQINIWRGSIDISKF